MDFSLISIMYSSVPEPNSSIFLNTQTITFGVFFGIISYVYSPPSFVPFLTSFI